MKMNLDDECKNLAIIIDGLVMGKEKCVISSNNFTSKDVIDYLYGFLDELKNLNNRIIDTGNTPELLKEVHDKYNELWMFQLECYIDNLPIVIGALWRYPNDN